MAKKPEPTKKTRKPEPEARQRKPAQKQQGGRGSLVKIGALWIGSGKNGKFMSGTIDIDGENTIRVLVFKNGYKEQDKHPDYVIYQPDGENEPNQQSNDDDIPF